MTRRSLLSRAPSRVPSTSPTIPAGLSVLASGVATPEERPPEPTGDRADRSFAREAFAVAASLFVLTLAVGLAVRGLIAFFP